jgi:pilus assembly protein Flp/PilA
VAATPVDAGAKVFRASLDIPEGYDLQPHPLDQELVHMRRLIARFIADQSGATAIEYGLIAAGISVVIIATVNGIGTKLNTKFTLISTQLR